MGFDLQVARHQKHIAVYTSVNDQISAQHNNGPFHRRAFAQNGVLPNDQERTIYNLSFCQCEIVVVCNSTTSACYQGEQERQTNMHQ
jgi:hypothetical protein